MTDSFWGWMRDVTAIAADLVFALLLDADDARVPVFASGNGAEPECYFAIAPGNAVHLYNTTDDTTCLCTFSRTDPVAGPQVEYIQVQPGTNVDVSSQFTTYADGSAGLAAVPSAAGVEDGNLVQLLLRVVPAAAVITVAAVGLSIVLPSAAKAYAIFRNQGTVRTSVRLSLQWGEAQTTLDFSETIDAGRNVQAAMPDGAIVPASFDQVGAVVAAPPPGDRGGWAFRDRFVLSDVAREVVS